MARKTKATFADINITLFSCKIIETTKSIFMNLDKTLRKATMPEDTGSFTGKFMEQGSDLASFIAPALPGGAVKLGSKTALKQYAKYAAKDVEKKVLKDEMARLAKQGVRLSERKVRNLVAQDAFENSMKWAARRGAIRLTGKDVARYGAKKAAENAAYTAPNIAGRAMQGEEMTPEKVLQEYATNAALDTTVGALADGIRFNNPELPRSTASREIADRIVKHTPLANTEAGQRYRFRNALREGAPKDNIYLGKVPPNVVDELNVVRDRFGLDRLGNEAYILPKQVGHVIESRIIHDGDAPSKVTDMAFDVLRNPYTKAGRGDLRGLQRLYVPHPIDLKRAKPRDRSKQILVGETPNKNISFWTTYLEKSKRLNNRLNSTEGYRRQAQGMRERANGRNDFSANLDNSLQAKGNPDGSHRGRSSSTPAGNQGIRSVSNALLPKDETANIYSSLADFTDTAIANSVARNSDKVNQKYGAQTKNNSPNNLAWLEDQGMLDSSTPIGSRGIRSVSNTLLPKEGIANMDHVNNFTDTPVPRNITRDSSEVNKNQNKKAPRGQQVSNTPAGGLSQGILEYPTPSGQEAKLPILQPPNNFTDTAIPHNLAQNAGHGKSNGTLYIKNTSAGGGPVSNAPAESQGTRLVSNTPGDEIANMQLADNFTDTATGNSVTRPVTYVDPNNPHLSVSQGIEGGRPQTVVRQNLADGSQHVDTTRQYGEAGGVTEGRREHPETADVAGGAYPDVVRDLQQKALNNDQSAREKSKNNKNGTYEQQRKGANSVTMEGREILREADDPLIRGALQRAQADGHVIDMVALRDRSGTKSSVELFNPERYTIDSGRVRDRSSGEIVGNHVQASPHGLFMNQGNKMINMSDVMGDLSQWKDLNKPTYTFDRILEKAAPDDATYRNVRRHVIEPKMAAEANMRTELGQFKQELKARKQAIDAVRPRGVSKSDFYADIFRYAERKLSQPDNTGRPLRQEAILEGKYGPKATQAIVNFDAWARRSYDDMLDRTNEVFRRFGYDEIPRRDNYMTHLQEPDFWSKIGIPDSLAQPLTTGMKGEMDGALRGNLDAGVAGLSADFTPSCKWNPYHQARRGNESALDPFKALDAYSDAALYNVHMTEPTVRARSLETAMRAADVAAESDVLRSLPDEVRNAFGYVGARNGRLAVAFQEYANALAGKTQKWDRVIKDAGRGGEAVMEASRKLQQIAGQSSIVGNMSVTLAQIMNLPNTIGTTGLKNTIRGIARSVGDIGNGKYNPKGAAYQKSDFLRARYTDASSPFRGKLSRLNDKVSAATLMPQVERSFIHIAWNSCYEKALAGGHKDLGTS